MSSLSTTCRLLQRAAVLALLLAAGAAQAQTASERVEALLAEMTLREKVGQMTQLTLTPLAAGPSEGRGRVALDPAKLREAVVERGIGSVINVHDEALPVEGWHALVDEIQSVARGESRLGIPVLYGIDNVHGANYVVGGTIFPHAHGLAGAFDRDLVERAGRVTAAETAAARLPWNFAPVLDVGRQPAWPRFYEAFGEDPTVAAELGAANVRGMQASGRVAATMKHYVGYGGPSSGRDRTPADLSDRLVRERFLPPFAAAVAAGAQTVMVNSGEIDGVPVHASRYWLTDVLRGELGFEGVVVTDWEDVIFLHTRHRVAPTMKDAVRLAVEAGIDMSMTPYDYAFIDLLVELVEEGTIPEGRVDASVRRVLALKEGLGLFDEPPADDPAVGATAHRDVARDAARQSVVLLKNEGGGGAPVLPLAAGARVAVVGPAADDLTALHGGWSYTWQGATDQFFPDGSPTLVDAIRERAGSVAYAQGATWDETTDFDAAVAAAADADVVVLALGETGYAEWVGDVEDLTLPRRPTPTGGGRRRDRDAGRAGALGGPAARREPRRGRHGRCRVRGLARHGGRPGAGGGPVRRGQPERPPRLHLPRRAPTTSPPTTTRTRGRWAAATTASPTGSRPSSPSAAGSATRPSRPARSA